MPPVIAYIGAFFTTALGGLTAYQVIARIALVVALNVISSKLFGPRAAPSVGLTAMQTTTRSALEFRKIVYGKTLISGPVVYINKTGGNGQDLWQVIALCDGQSDDIVRIFFDTYEIPAADIDWTPGTGASDGTGTGAVSTTRWQGDDSPATVAANIFYYLGDDAQPVCGPLASEFSDITTSFRLRGVTYIVIKTIYIPATAKVWREGLPNDFKALIKGRRIYDPRLDTTNGGAGAHRYLTASTWEYSSNPALCLADYLMVYMGADPAASINWPAVVIAADACDVQVEIPPASSPANTEPRFTCHTALSLGSTHKDNLEILLSAMDGRLTYSGGAWTMRASVWEAAAYSFTADDLAGPVSVRGSAPRSDRFNSVRGFFIDPARGYNAAEFAPVSAAEFVTRDNGETLEYDLELPATNSDYTAQRIAYRVLEQGDNQVMCDIVLNARGLKIAPGDVIDLTIDELAWAAKTFRVVNWTRTQDNTYEVALREDQATSYVDPLVSEYATTAQGVITFPAEVVPPPTALAAAAAINGVAWTWTNPAARLFESVELWISDDNNRANAVKTTDTTGTEYFETLISKFRNRYGWIRSRSFDGTYSTWEPAGATAGVTNNPKALPIGLVIDSDFDLSTALGDTGDGLNYFWTQSTTDDAGIPGTASAITFQTGGGANGSNAVKLVKGNPPNFPTTSTGQLDNEPRFRHNVPNFRITVRWRNNGARAFTNLKYTMIGWDAETGGSATASATTTVASLAVTGTTWQTATYDVTVTPADDAQFWSLRLSWSDGSPLVERVEIDSVFVFANP